MLMNLGLSGPAMAQSGATERPLPEPILSIADYRGLNVAALGGLKSSYEALVWFVFGLRTTLTATSDAYVAAGAKRRICIPSDVRHGDLLVVINDEMEGNRAYWEARRKESVVPMAIQAFARKWPCP